MTKIWAYKMTTDSGFAPNPYENILSLATCMPNIRRACKKDYWLAGFAAKGLSSKEKIYSIEDRKLIYLAKIDDVVPLGEYYNKYPKKRPNPPHYCLNGDNIYQCIGEDKYIQHDINRNHFSELAEEQKKIEAHDTGGENALLAREFYYFGCNPPALPKKLHDTVYSRPQGSLPRHFIINGEAADNLIAWVKEYACKKYNGKSGKLEKPHTPLQKINKGKCSNC